MTDTAKTTKIAVPLTPEDRERLRKRAEHDGLSPATFARMLIKRELRNDPVAA
jgi:predicted DNA binding CopG/RHH family protein